MIQGWQATDDSDSDGDGEDDKRRVDVMAWRDNMDHGMLEVKGLGVNRNLRTSGKVPLEKTLYSNVSNNLRFWLSTS